MESTSKANGLVAKKMIVIAISVMFFAINTSFAYPNEVKDQMPVIFEMMDTISIIQTIN